MPGARSVRSSASVRTATPAAPLRRTALVDDEPGPLRGIVGIGGQAGAFDRNVRRGRRLSAAGAYLRPAMTRENLTVLTRAQVDQVLFAGDRAVGVEFRRGRGAPQEVYAKEIILCGGAINTPQLLQLSGVGGNLQDHLEVYIQHTCLEPVSMMPSLATWKRPFIGARWLFGRTGPAATNHFEGGGFARSNDQVGHPNLMFHFLPVAIRYDGSAAAAKHGYQVHVGPMSPTPAAP